MKPVWLTLLTLTATALHANYAEDAYDATYKLYNVANSGTCSLYQRPAPDTAIYLVTTQHQMKGAKGNTSLLVLREPQSDGSYKRNDFKLTIRKNDQPAWVRHPKFDIAVLKIDHITGTYKTLPTSAIANDERLRAAKPAIGTSFILFTFPHSVESVDAGFPVARHVSFAAPPLLSSDAYPTFYADFPATAGDSGGPGLLEYPQGHPLIVGMCFERENHDEKITTEITSTVIKHPLYLGGFIHGKYLLETIEEAAKN
jgi:hypothetical protein